MSLLPWLSSGVLGSSLKGNLCHNKSNLRPAGREPLGLKRWWRWRRQWDDETCGNGWMGCQVGVSQALKRERPQGVAVQSSPSVRSWKPGCFHCPHPRAVSGAVTVLWCPLHGSYCVSWEEDCPPVRSGPLWLRVCVACVPLAGIMTSYPQVEAAALVMTLSWLPVWIVACENTAS